MERLVVEIIETVIVETQFLLQTETGETHGAITGRQYQGETKTMSSPPSIHLKK